MPSTTTAADLMTKRFLRISTGHTLSEMLSIVLYGEQKKHDTGAIVLIDSEAEFAGIVTHNTLAAALAPPLEETQSFIESSEGFFQAIASRMNLQITDYVSAKDWTPVRLKTSLAKLAIIASETGNECLPVIEDGRVEGLVYTTDIFAATANAVLTPESEGINLP